MYYCQALGLPEEVRFSHRRAPAPPPFMLDLYNSVADGRGRWRAPTPFDANVVRSHRETGEHERLQLTRHTGINSKLVFQTSLAGNPRDIASLIPNERISPRLHPIISDVAHRLFLLSTKRRLNIPEATADLTAARNSIYLSR